MQPWLGTFVEVTVPDGPNASAAMRAGFAAVAEVHRLLSYQDPDSDLSRLNRNAGGPPVTLDSLTIRVLRLAVRVMRASEGLFNCTTGGLLERLGVLPPAGTPAPRDCGDADDIEIIDARTARLRRPVHVTLDGIAKGYAVDRAVRAMTAAGAAGGSVNAGGDLRVVGPMSAPLSVRTATGFRPIAEVSGLAVATSVTGGENSSIGAKVRPRFPGRIVSAGGVPVAAGTWTVAATSAWRADALTKVAPMLPAPARAAGIARLGGRLIVDGDVR